MKSATFTLFIWAVCAIGCQTDGVTPGPPTISFTSAVLQPDGKTLVTRFNPPPGFHRQSAGPGSFTTYLRNLPLKKHGALVRYYDGTTKNKQGVYAAVVDMEIGNRDLQQCADAVMRLRAEYLFAIGKKDQIRFHFNNGFLADFSKWMEGYRIAVTDRNASWVKKAAAASDHSTLRNYLDVVYSYASTLSLAKELRSVEWADMQPGDVLIRGGSPGHAEAVMDMAVDARGRKVFLLSQSYMPAQDIQILENPSDKDISPWYKLNAAPYTVETPEYYFSTLELKRWQ